MNEEKQPLWMPKGSVRSILALGVVLASAGGSAFLIVENSGGDLANIVVGAWAATLGSVVAFYFGTRVGS
jgi:hypothetical protein